MNNATHYLTRVGDIPAPFLVPTPLTVSAPHQALRIALSTTMGNAHSRNAAKKNSLVKLKNLVSPVPSDIDVAQAANVVPIRTIAAACGLSEADYEPYGHFKAKVRRR